MTYSIVAFDPETQECGVAVQSHWFSVGSLVTWAEPGAGAVATQAAVAVPPGPVGLDLMRAGHSAPEALAARIAEDPLAVVRQVGMVDARGGVAAHTGSECMDFAGQVVGHHHSCQGNLMKTETVWGAMSEAYEGSSGRLADRLLAALDAGEAAGGDLRGRQSAAILVVPAAGESWETVVDLRVEDHEDPLVELRRLMELRESYRLIHRADELAVQGETLAAADLYIAALERTPDNDELKFWAALAMFDRGEGERGAALMRETIGSFEGWRQLLAQLPPEMSSSVAEVRRLVGVQALGAGGGAGGTGPT